MRLAVYATPRPDAPLLARAEAWFGRSAFGRGVTADPGPFDADEHAALVASRARYGFHATLKAPFEPVPGTDPAAVAAALDRFAAAHGPVDLGPMRVARLGAYLALVPVDQTPATTAFAQAVVEAFEPFRAPLSDHDRARRGGEGLSAREAELLDRWGYAATEELFRFHMTLAGPAPAPLLDRAEAHLAGLLAPCLDGASTLDMVALFEEPVRPGPFRIRHAAALGALLPVR